jgi:hypothetical protein
MATATTPTKHVTPRLSCDQILRIALLDAEPAYRDLTPFVIRLSLETQGWQIDFTPKNPGARGGGPHYVIDPTTGDILHKRYEQ